MNGWIIGGLGALVGVWACVGYLGYIFYKEWNK